MHQSSCSGSSETCNLEQLACPVCDSVISSFVWGQPRSWVPRKLIHATHLARAVHVMVINISIDFTIFVAQLLCAKHCSFSLSLFIYFERERVRSGKVGCAHCCAAQLVSIRDPDPGPTHRRSHQSLQPHLTHVLAPRGAPFSFYSLFPRYPVRPTITGCPQRGSPPLLQAGV